MSGDLLAEATSLSEQHYGPDPIVEASTAVAEADLAVPEPDFSPIPDPGAGTPYEVEEARVLSTLEATAPEVVQTIGAEGVTAATAFLRAVPREIAGVLDEAGALGSRHTWALMATLGAGIDPDVDPGPVPEVHELEAHAAEYELPGGVEAAANVRVLIEALPASVRAAITPEMAASPDLWELAAHLGAKLWSYEPMWPPRPAPQPDRAAAPAPRRVHPIDPTMLAMARFNARLSNWRH